MVKGQPNPDNIKKGDVVRARRGCPRLKSCYGEVQGEAIVLIAEPLLCLANRSLDKLLQAHRVRLEDLEVVGRATDGDMAMAQKRWLDDKGPIL